MKNSSNRILQAVKWASPLAAIALAVALSQPALAQPDSQMNTLQGPTAVFVDVTNPPLSLVHNDMYFTNTVHEVQVVDQTGWSAEFNMPGISVGTAGAGGSSFLATNYGAAGTDIYGNQIVAITNLSIQLFNGSTSGSYAAGADYGPPGAPANTEPPLVLTTSFPLTAVQPYEITFWQISGTSDPSGLGSNATMIAQYITQPGRYYTLNDWITFSNIQVFLQPGTTNAYTAAITSNGFGYAPWGMNTNTGETTTSPAPYVSGHPVIITNDSFINGSSTAGVVNYGIAAGLQNGLYITNYSTIFFAGVNTNFLPPVITTNPVSSVVYTNTTGQTATFFAGASGVTNGQDGMSGNWYFTNVLTPTVGTLITPGWQNPVSGTMPFFTTTSSSPTIVNYTGANVNSPGMTLNSTLTVPNFANGDAGSYVFVVTNSPGGAVLNTVSTIPATITFMAPPATSFAAAITNPALGLLAFWPLNETGDPSSGTVVAYDWVAQHNGWYAWNTDTSASNSLDKFPKSIGPTNQSGLGYTSAYGGTNLDWSFVNIPQGPAFPGTPGSKSTATNATFVAWIYPFISEVSSCGLIVQRMNGQYQSNSLGYGSTAGALGNVWANNGATYNAGLSPTISNWNFVAWVITPSNNVVYLGVTNHALQTAFTSTAGLQTNYMGTWGTNMQIGTDLAGADLLTRAFYGNISSVAIFGNSLTAPQLENLWAAGAGGPGLPTIVTQPLFSNYSTIAGGSAEIMNPVGYGGGGSTCYWQYANTMTPGVVTNWGPFNVNNTDFIQPAEYTNLQTGYLQGALTVTNFHASDAGSYQFIVNNSLGSVTSTVITLSLYTSGPNTFISQATNPAYGLVALWPLDETTDPSTGNAPGATKRLAYDVVGGWNGTYGTNADNGAGNAVTHMTAIAGPGSATYNMTGLPTAGALGVTNTSALAYSYVIATNGPTLWGLHSSPVDTTAVNATNATILGWVYPTLATASQPANAGDFMANGASSGEGLGGPAAGELGYHWDGNTGTAYNFASGLYIPGFMWSMIGVAISPTSSVFYLGNTNQGLLTATQWWTNASGAGTQINVPLGTNANINIGNDAYQIPARNFVGYMSSFALFSNTLTAAQVESLFNSGVSDNPQGGPPFIIANIPAACLVNYLLPGGSSTNSITATAYDGAGYWQVLVGGNWVTLSSADFSSTLTVPAGLNQTGTLQVNNFTPSSDAGSYRLLFTNYNGPGGTLLSATSSVVVLAQAPAIAANSFAGQALNPANGMGAVAYWPLNETADTSGGVVGGPPMAAAYEYIGGNNGTYGTNARDGGTNVAYHYSPVVGPGAQGYLGLPSTGALGVSNLAASPDAYVLTVSSPVFPEGPTYGTNVSIVGWIYPTTFPEAYQTGFIDTGDTQGAGAPSSLGYGDNGVASAMGYQWNGAGYNTAVAPSLIPPTNVWSMVAMVVSPSSYVFYLANTNVGVLTATVWQTNATGAGIAPHVAWGGPVAIGTDLYNVPGRNFLGYMSSFAMFSNSLTIPQIDLLFASGVANTGQIAPIADAVPPPFQTNYLIAGGYSSSIAVAGYGGTNGGGFWLQETSPGVFTSTLPADLANATVVPNGPMLQGTLYVTNFNVGSSDAGSYVLVISNQVNGVSAFATSGVVVLAAPVVPVSGSFAAAITNPAYGLVAFWPLNETNDPSSGTATAYDIVGGFNGLYGTNAIDGGTNSLNHWAPDLGPSSALGLAGFQTPDLLGFPCDNGALGSFQNIGSNTASFVTTTGTPSLSPNGTSATNATIIAWVYPTNNAEAYGTSVFMTRSGQLGATNTAGIQLDNTNASGTTAATGTAGFLGYHWNNDANTEYQYSTSLPIPTNSWSMLVLVITPSNNYFYVANTNNGLISAIQLMQNNSTGLPTNYYVGMGGAADIGTDPGNSPGRNFGGLISSVAMFSNSLTVAQIQTLYETGLNLNSDAPFITQNPTPNLWEVVPGKNVTFTAAGYGGSNASGYWQVYYPGGSSWVTINSTSVGSTVSGDVSGYSVSTSLFWANQTNTAIGPAGSGIGPYTDVALITGTLTITGAQTADAGSYRLVITNAPVSPTSYQYAYSAPGLVTLYVAPPGSFIGQAMNTANAYNLLSLWPLNETNDPSGALTGNPAVAYDIISGFNGTYGTNARDGGSNTLNGFAPVPGPGVLGYLGLPTQGALGVTNVNQSWVVTTNCPKLSLPYPNSSANGTNVTIVGWLYPTTSSEVSDYGIFHLNGASGSLYDGPTAQNSGIENLGFYWNGGGYSYTTGPSITPFVWDMIALVITPTNAIFYVGNNELGLVSGSYTNANVSRPWGAPVVFGIDPYSVPGRNFEGYMSSFAMFSNSLSVTNIENLFNAGLANDAQQPIFATNPLSYQFITNTGFSNNVKFIASAYGGQPNITGCWQMSPANNPGVWTNLVATSTHYQGAVPTNGTTWTNLENSTLYITNITSADVGSYRLLVTNGLGNWATSVVATIYLINPNTLPANSFAALANDPNGLVAYWPLNETQDPSGAMSNNPAEAFDLIGGNNGIYGLYANNGGGNALLGLSPVPASGFTGLPSGGALGASNNLLNSFVTTLTSPLTFTNSTMTNTNMTIVAWVYPTASEVANTGLVFERTSQVDGLMYSPTAGANQLGYTWNNVGTYTSGPTIPQNTWSMVAMVITATNSTLYVANAVAGVLPNPVVSQTVSNAYQTWGGALALGGDTGNNPARTFSGYLSSVAIFSNALTSATIQNLFLDGYDLGVIPVPVITTQPASPSFVLYTNANVTMSAAGFGYPPAGGYWQFANTITAGVTNWNILQNTGGAANNYGVGVAGGAQIQGSGAVALQITNVSAADVGSYELVFTNGNLAGTAATSSVVVVTLVPNSAEPAPGSYAATVLSNTFGAVAFWPLNETVDPASGTALAYDVIGGHNGLYGTNAANGFGNSKYGWTAVQGPAAAGLAGFAAGGALGSLQNWLPNTYVTMSNTPIFPGLNSGDATAVNSTNMTLVAWINPQTNEAGATGLMMTRAGTLGATRTDGMDYGPTAPQLGYIWDNNAAPTYGLNSGIAIPNSNWSMVALVITPNSNILYLGTNSFLNASTNFLNAYVQTIVNSNEPWGLGMAIGGDPGASANSITNRSFGGWISSVAMFSNSLTAGQIEALWLAGVSNGAPSAPFITTQPVATNIELLAPGGVATISAAGFAAQPGGGYWQMWNGSQWVQVTTTDVSAPTILTSLGGATGTLQQGALMFTNFQVADAGSYELVLTNSAGSATSQVVNVSSYYAAPNGYASVADSAGYGAVALWPLSETVDPSSFFTTGLLAVAYDVVGGFNGTYGTNADNGAGNAVYSLAAVAGPGAQGYVGLPSAGALGVTNIAALAQSFVTASNTPAFQASATNVSITGWIYPTSTAQDNSAGIFITANAVPGVAGMQYDNALLDLGYHWDNNTANTYDYQGPALTPMIWNFVALVITPTNSLLYVGTTNTNGLASGLLVATQTTNNMFENWGGAAQIGTDITTTPPGRNFNGLMSSFAMFNKSLTVAQVQNLFAAGVSNGVWAPWIQVQPLSTNLEIASGASLTISATAYTGSTGVAYWQTNTGSGWGTIANNSDVVASSVYGTTVGASLVDALQITNFGAGDAASYQCVFNNNGGSVTSIVVQIGTYTAPPGSFAYMIATNKALGAMSLWPLNESGDPSVTTVTAYDVIGGYNGIYGTNAQTATPNSYIVGNYPGLSLSPVPGPDAATPPYTGLPATALGCVASNTALPQVYAIVPVTPILPAGTTNATLLMWIYPTNAVAGMPTEQGNVGMFIQRLPPTAGTGYADGFQYATAANGYSDLLGYHWDADTAATYNYTGGPLIPSNSWSLIGLVVTPTTNWLYVGNATNGLVGVPQTMSPANIYIPFGSNTWIGGDPYTQPGRNFSGLISSAAMFSNSLTVPQLQALFQAGLALGTEAPFIIANPPTATYELAPGSQGAITATGFAGPAGGGYWQFYNGSSWVAAYTPDGTGTNAVPYNGGNLAGILQFTNFQATDAGSYRLVLTNANGPGGTILSAYSSVVTINAYSVTPGSFAAVATSAGYGVVALWPLNETNDPSAGGVAAYDVIGGNNGIYGTNAQNGSTNMYIYNNFSQYSYGPIAGPGNPTNADVFTGLPTTALGSLNGETTTSPPLTNTFVITTTSPAFPNTATSGTNVSIVAWICASASPTAREGIVGQRINTLNDVNTDNLETGGGSSVPTADLGYIWNNNSSTTYNLVSGLVIHPNIWYMAALVVSPATNYLYLCATNIGVQVVTQAVANINQPWGNGLTIGTDDIGGSGGGDNFGGSISSAAIFSNSLTLLQIQTLFDAGIASGYNAPFITANPLNSELVIGSSATMSATGYVGTSGGGYWQFWNGTSWVPVTSPDISFTTNIGANMTIGLTVTNFKSTDAGSYRLALTNLNGVGGATLTAYSAPASLEIFTILPNSFAAAITNPALGAVAYWPLNETNDPSTGTVVAYDVIGGHNGLYQTNAQDGGPNAGLQTVLANLGASADYVSPVPGPSNAVLGNFAYVGLPATAYSSINNLLMQTLVTTTTSPNFATNSTNATFLLWLYPNANMAAPACYLTGTPNYANLMHEVSGEFGASSTDGSQLDILPNGSGIMVLGYNWDNNLGADNTFNTGLIVPSNQWSMYAFVITPSNTTFYLGNTNGLQTAVQTIAHSYVPWGAGISLGGDANAYPGPGATAIENFFQGSISSVAVFTNALTQVQFNTLFLAGSAGTFPPVITVEPAPLQPLIQGGNASIKSTGYGATGGFWRQYNGSSYVAITSPDFSGANAAVSNGIYQQGTLVLTNFQISDAGTYVFIVTNSVGVGATSSPVVIQAVIPAPGSFAAALVQIGGAVAFWPLGEVGDCSKGTNIAYDIIGGFNGTYGVNAQSGGQNSVLDALSPSPAYDQSGGVPGPGSAGYTGLPTTAYGGIHAYSTGTTYFLNTSVNTASGPTFTGTNQSIVMWIAPNTAQTSHEGIFTIRNASPGQTNGLSTGVGGTGQLNYNWDNNAGATTAFVTGLVIDTNQVWSLVALVVTASNSTLYLGSTATGLQSSTQTISNIVEMGGPGVPIYIGTDPNNGNNSDSYGGALSSVAMFSNALTPLQISTLFDAGTSSGTAAPYFVSEPPFPMAYAQDVNSTNASYMVVVGGSLTITASAYVGPNGGAYWQTNNANNPNLWGNVNSPDATNASSTAQSNPNSLNLNCSLTFTNLQASDAGTYQVVITNGNGSGGINSVISIPVNISVIPAPPANSFEAVAISYGAVALWPLNETSYTALGGALTGSNVVEAYDVVGGWNGLYGWNAENGFNGIAGPQPPDFLGFPSGNGGLFASPLYENIYVTTVASPTIPAGCTNVTLLAWVSNTAYIQSNSAGIVVMRAGGQTNGLCYSANYNGANYLDYYWNGGNGPNGGDITFVDPPSNTWSMLAMVTTPSNVTLYICSTNGIVSAPQTIANAYQSWGQAITIGGDPLDAATGAENFNGTIGAVTIFTNALSLSEISVLFNAGLDLDAGPPTIITEPSSTAAYEQRGAVFSVQASGSTALSYQWQILVNGVWTNIQTQPVATYGTASGYNGNTLTIVAPTVHNNFKTNTYQVVIWDEGGTNISSPVTLTIAPSVGNLSPYSVAVTNLSTTYPGSLIAYWELNEAAGPTADDYWGGYSGTYETNVSVGLGTQTTPAGPGAPDVPDWVYPNYSSNQFPGMASGYATSPMFTNAYIIGTNWLSDNNLNASNDCLSSSYISIPALNLNSSAMTLIIWIYPNENQGLTNGLFYCRGAGTQAGFGFADVTNGTLGYNWNNVSGTYTWNSGLTPEPTNWNMIAYVVSSNNTTIYCYNTNSQKEAVNSVTNALLAWGEPATLGSDLYDTTGHRQFDGSIAEVAVYNQALPSSAINNLFYVATGIAAPPVFTTEPSSSGASATLVNEGGNGVYTAVVANGPNLGVVWQGPGVSMPTNGTYAFSIYPGATFTVNSVGTDPITTTLTISNLQASMAGLTFDVLATNSTYSTYNLVYINLSTYSTVILLPGLFPTPALWTTDVNVTNAYNAGQQIGVGVISSGTIWNPISGSASGGYYYNVSSSNDVGTIANTGVSVGIQGTGAANDGTGNYLFDVYEGLSGVNQPNGLVLKTQPGFYNLFIYSMIGAYDNRGLLVTIDGFSQGCTNVSGTQGSVNYGIANPAPAAGGTGNNYVYQQNSNYCIFTNVFISNGTLNVALNTNQGGSTDQINAMQVQLITPYSPLALSFSNGLPVVSYAGCTLLSTTNLLNGGNWQPVVGAPTALGTNTYVLPVPAIKAGKPSSAIFYETEATSPVNGLNGHPYQ